MRKLITTALIPSATVQGGERLAADRAWVRWGVVAAVTGMLAWLVGFALIPQDAKLDKGEQHLVQVLRAHTGQLYTGALLAVLGAVLLAAFFAVLTRLVPEGHPGWGLLRVSLAVCVITQTMVAIGTSFGLAGLSPLWVSALGWLSAAAHLLVLFTVAQRGAFALDGIIAGLVPLTTVIWILALAATLPRSWRTAATAAFGTGG